LRSKVVYKNNASDCKVLIRPKKAGEGLKVIELEAEDYIIVRGAK